jgi:hypothetical protein
MWGAPNLLPQKMKTWTDYLLVQIYSGRGGRFYNNIDEDSSDPHFGYLIVRLPHVHEGCSAPFAIMGESVDNL